MFEARAAELRAYIEFLITVEKVRTRLSTGRRTIDFDAEVKKMLKATFFLVAYNIVEATTRAAFQEIYDQSDGVVPSFDKLIDGWQRTVVKSHLRRFVSGDRDVGAHYDTVIALAARTAERLHVSLQGLPFSGNVDQILIREWCDDHNIKMIIPKSAQGGQSLSVIRNKRNELAHGEISFGDLGKDYFAGELRDMTRRMTRFMDAFLRAIDASVIRKTFLRV